MIILFFIQFLICDEVENLFTSINTMREENELEPFEIDTTLNDLSYKNAMKIAKTGDLPKDTSEEQKNVRERLESVNLGFRAYSAVEMNFKTAISVASTIFRTLQNLNEDDNPILQKRFSKIGLGTSKVPKSDEWVWDLLFISTEKESDEE